jgi:hypothetical protein
MTVSISGSESPFSKATSRLTDRRQEMRAFTTR